jgi:CubicO group peptidase (beta-lactamase class C family)
MTAEDLARWIHALFHGKVPREDSLRQMQSFGPGAYGLGLGRFGFGVGGGLTAVGHGDANIGTGAYMVYLPNYEVSIAVMVNRVFSGCEARIVRDLARITALSFRPGRYYFDILHSPIGFMAGPWLLAGLGAALYGIRKDKPVPLLVLAGLAFVAGGVAMGQWSPLELVLLPVAGTVGALGLTLFLRRLVRRPVARQ